MSENPCHKGCVNRSLTSKDPCVSVQEQHSGDVIGPVFQIKDKLDEVYEKRLAEIDEQANGDASLKEITYKEWIEMLRQINTTLITNIQELEHETTKRLALLQRKANIHCRLDQISGACKHQKDFDGLVQFIRNAKQNNDWSVDNIDFDTFDKNNIFGNEASCDQNQNVKQTSELNRQSVICDSKPCTTLKSKLFANVKALAFEVADKHDEIRDLRKQVLSMEDEIQKAQKKIQLKDDVIRELRNDLKSFPKCSALWGRRASERISPNNCLCPSMPEAKISESCDFDEMTTPRAGSHINRDSINSINLSEFSLNIQDDEEDEEELIKCLQEELTQLFEMKDTYDQNIGTQKRAIQDLQNRISETVHKLIKINNDQQNKLRFYRRELINLENPQSSRTMTDEDSGISPDLDNDSKRVNAIRNRIGCLLAEKCRLQNQEQKLQIENEGLNSQVKAKSALLDKTSKTLSDVAETLSIALCRPVHCELIFEETSNTNQNPIVEAINNLIDNLTEREKTIGALRQQIANSGKTILGLQSNSEDLEDELFELKKSMRYYNQLERNGMLFHNQEFQRKIIEKAEQHDEESLFEPQENHNECLRIIEDLTTDLNTLSCQVNMVQNEFLDDEIAGKFERSLKGLEAQNDLLQAAIDSLIEEKTSLERILNRKNEELKRAVCSKEEEILFLRNEITGFKHTIPCDRCKTRLHLEDVRHQRHRPQRTESDEQLLQLESELRRKGKTIENLKLENEKLQDELTSIRKKEARMKLVQRREASADRRNNPQDLVLELKATQEKNLEHCKSLSKASKEITCLQLEIEKLHENEDILRKERDLLQSELTALKESQASQKGRLQSLKEQLQMSTSDFYAAKEKLKECTQEKDYIEKLQSNEKKQFQLAIAEVLEKHNNLVDDFNKMGLEYQKLVQIVEEKTKTLSAFNNWKDEQIESERIMQRKMQMIEDHLRDILEDKQNLLDRLKNSESDNQILRQTLENSRLQSAGNQSIGAIGSMRGYNTLTTSSSVDTVSRVIDNVRHTSRRLSQQRSILEDDCASFLSK